MSLKNKILIFNSDDFGHCHASNMAVYMGLKSGVLNTSCILANLEGYEEAHSLSFDLKGIKFGIHLNAIEGKSLTNSKFLSDKNRNFNNGYISILKKSFNKDFMNALEFEFRAQIERILNDFEINHINSHIHIHSIPNVFKLVVKLAEEYKIPYVRTCFENPYYAKMPKPVNLVKLGLLNILTLKNRKNLSEKITTNDFLIGVTYTGAMDKNTVLKGLKAVPYGVCEILIHPRYYEKKIDSPDNYREFLITQDKEILNDIKSLGFITADFDFCRYEPNKS